MDTAGNLYVTTGNGRDSQPFLAALSCAGCQYGHVVAEIWPLATARAQRDLHSLELHVHGRERRGSGRGRAIVLPDIPGPVRHALVVGGKQGNAYLLNRDSLPGTLASQPNNPTPISTMDQSLVPPTAFSYYTNNGATPAVQRGRSMFSVPIRKLATKPTLPSHGRRRHVFKRVTARPISSTRGRQKGRGGSNSAISLHRAIEGEYFAECESISHGRCL